MTCTAKYATLGSIILNLTASSAGGDTQWNQSKKMHRVIKASTVRELVDQMAATRADLDFLISPETGRTLTFGALRTQLLGLCSQFHQLGLRRGDKIAFLMDNGLFTVQLFLATMFGGFVAVPLNVRAGLSQLSHMLNDCDAEVVFVGTEYRALIKEAMASILRRIEIIPADIDGCQESPANVEEAVLAPIVAEDPALLMYSSGSTGLPKGAIHTQRSVLAHGRNSARSHELGRRIDLFLFCLSITSMPSA